MRHIIVKTAKAAVVVLCHAFSACILVLAFWVVEKVTTILGNGQSMLIYDKWPLAYLFQTIDVGMIALFGGFGLYEAFKVLNS